MNIRKIIFMILFTNFCTISGLDDPPELVRTFFKRFCTQLGSSPEWTFTTPRITTSWGNCIITDNDITVTIGDQTACWITSGGPWAIQYISATETVSLKPQQNFTQSEWTINPPFAQEAKIADKLAELSSKLSSMQMPAIPKAPTIPTEILPKVFKAPTPEEIILDYHKQKSSSMPSKQPTQPTTSAPRAPKAPIISAPTIPKAPRMSSATVYSLPKKPKLTLPKLAYPQRFYTNEQIVNAAWNWFGWRTLTLESEDIDTIIAEINYYAHSNHLKTKDILQALQKKIEDAIHFHQERIEKKHYYRDLALDCVVGIGCCAINIALAGITCYIYKKWHKGSNNKIEKIRHDLKNMGVEIQNRSDNYGTKIINYIDLVGSRPLSNQDFSYARQCRRQLVTLENDKEWAFNAEIWSAVATLICCKASIPLLLAVISQRLYPIHQEYCEKLLLIQEKITVQCAL